MKKFLMNDSGVTAVEYGVMASVMGLGLLAMMPLFKGSLSTSFSTLGSRIVVGS